MSQPRAPLRRILVAGAGQVGVTAAIAMKRALPSAQVVVLQLPLDPGALADRATTALPFANHLHDRLGIAEADIVARAEGSHRLVTRYFNWGISEGQGAVPYGSDLASMLSSRFEREWAGGARGATDTPVARSLAEVLADAGRFAVPPPDAMTPISDVDYALRWDPAKYRALLIAKAQELGVQHMAGQLADIHSDEAGGIATLEIAGVGQVEADLFLDCSGPAALLLSRLPDFALDQWSSHLPLRRVLLAKPQQKMLALEDRITLLPEGWLMETGGRDGLQIMLGWADGVPERAALAALGVPPLAGFTLDPGCAREIWLGNVIAIGDAAARFEPLGHLNLDLVHRQIDLLLEMLPGQDFRPSERTEFNRRSTLMMAAVRDTLALHYASPRAKEVFGSVDMSPELARALDQFTRRGRIPFREEMPLLSQEILALASALGFHRGIMPQARALGAVRSKDDDLAFADKARAALAFAPPYSDWMRSHAPMRA